MSEEGITVFSRSTRPSKGNVGQVLPGARGNADSKVGDIESSRITPDDDTSATFGGGEASFRALGLSQWLSSNVIALGITKPTLYNVVVSHLSLRGVT